MLIYERGDTVRLSDGSVGMILRMWDDRSTYDVGVLDPDIPMDDERKRRYDVPYSEIKGKVKQVTAWVDITPPPTMTVEEAQKRAEALGHTLGCWEEETNILIKQKVSACQRTACGAMAFVFIGGPVGAGNDWYLGRALTEECEGL